ncbi:NAD(P)H dehydrogenase (quinone) [Isoptericola jiangsuensis]|uniref:NAD(P)H dehydrogenase (Quinone) n=1 Tax=Isoptericola jiangsuensis TaxID=548579 RepID=A0A2A9ET80_9MICO|nr:NAD(P)H-dependent oxidoreductase [Isoptericola jiangsuensis]PFG41480.1 NAD(P)H dehydrogenase (quinone) [Isoptericola jiangsuensis]
MHLLTVFAHPVPTSYPRAVVDAFHQPVHAAGHTIDLLDLHEEDFDPRFGTADHDHFWGGPAPAGIAEMHARVEAADRLAFVYPVYWWGMPALMKGWIERVFTGGWAYQYGAGVQDRGRAPVASKLTNTPTLLLGLAGSTERTYDRYGYREAMQTQIDVGTFAYCGIDDVESHLVFDVEGTDKTENRDAGLREAQALAARFLDPDRTPNAVREQHLRTRGEEVRPRPHP